MAHFCLSLTFADRAAPDIAETDDVINQGLGRLQRQLMHAYPTIMISAKGNEISLFFVTKHDDLTKALIQCVALLSHALQRWPDELPAWPCIATRVEEGGEFSRRTEWAVNAREAMAHFLQP